MNENERNRSDIVCNMDLTTIENYHLYTSIICSIASLVGNILVILIVYLNKTLRSTPNYVIVNMAVSDVFSPSMHLVYNILIDQKRAGDLSAGLGSALCRFEFIFINFSFGVSMLSLVVITVHRFYAVAWPLRARFERFKSCILLLLCTWIVPAAVFGTMIPFITFETSLHVCVSDMNEHYYLVHSIVNEIVFIGAPLVVMIVLYPLIIVKLRRQRVLGNATSTLIVKRRKQNVLLTKMFLTIIFSLILTYLTNDVVHFIQTTWRAKDTMTLCTLSVLWAAVAPLPLIFHAVSPLIYFIFCSSYREGVKSILYCHNRHYANGRSQSARGNIIPLENLTQRS